MNSDSGWAAMAVKCQWAPPPCPIDSRWQLTVTSAILLAEMVYVHHVLPTTLERDDDKVTRVQ